MRKNKKTDNRRSKRVSKPDNWKRPTKKSKNTIKKLKKVRKETRKYRKAKENRVKSDLSYARKSSLKVLTSSQGSYPKIGDSPELQNLRRAYARKEVGDITNEEFRKVEQDFIRLAIEEQEKAGIDIVTDGMISWYDQISHFAKNIEGIKINGLLRFFDTNTYFRQPIINGTPESPQMYPVLLEDFKFAKSVAKRLLKPVVTGPVTLAKLTKGEFKKALDIYAKLIENEVRILSEEGAEYIQVDEPALTASDLDLSYEYYKRIFSAKKAETKLIYYFYFRDFSKDFKPFQEIPCDIIGFDMTYSNLEDTMVKHKIKKPLVLGIFDGRTTYIEKPNDIIPRVRKILKAYPYDFIIIGPSCGLEYLPRKFANLKLRAVVRISKMIKS